MEKVVKEFIKYLALEVAKQVAKQLQQDAPKEDAPKGEPMLVKAAAERSENEWRADCLTIINMIAPTHGPAIRALFASYNAKRLPELTAAQLPGFLADLVSLRDA